MDKGLQECIQKCIDCGKVAIETSVYLLQSKDKLEGNAIQLLLDCAEICQVTSNLMIRKSTFHQLMCGICADICEACAKECGKHGEDEQLTECAAMCRLCSESCEEMTTFAIHQV